MNKDELINIASLRVSIGYLGEKDQYGWWDTSFFAPTSKSFLDPIYNKTSFLARYHSVREAAMKIHDQHIGIGANVFHLFRLPEYIEQELHEIIVDSDIAKVLNKTIQTIEASFSFLNEISISNANTAITVGPMQIGNIDEIEEIEIWKRLASLYTENFKNNNKVFPYFVEQN